MAAMAGSHLLADEAPKAADPETLVTSLFKTLTDDQKKEIAFPFDHALRSRIENNWNISRSADILGIDRVTLYNKIAKYGLQRPA